MAYSEIIPLYLYANHLQKNHFCEFYLKVLKIVALRVLTDECGNNCDFSWKLMPPPVRKYIVFSFSSNTSKKFRKHRKHNKLCKSML